MSRRLPKFPDSCTLSEARPDQVLELARRAEASDYGLSLYAWDPDETTRVSQLGDGLVVRFDDYVDPSIRRFAWSGARLSQAEAGLLGGEDEICLVSSGGVAAIREWRPHAQAIEQIDDSDYLLSTEEYVHLVGRRFRKHREARNWLNRQQYSLEELDFGEAAEIEASDFVWRAWTLEHIGLHSPPASRELRSLVRLRECWGSLERWASLRVFVLRVDGRPVASQIVEASDDTEAASPSAIVHYSKARRVNGHVDLAFSVAVCGSLHARGVQWVNWMQDLGLPGLRTHKRRLQPIRLIRKFTVVTGERSVLPLGCGPSFSP